MWVYFKDFNCILSVCMFILMTVPHCFHCCSFIVSFKIGKLCFQLCSFSRLFCSSLFLIWRQLWILCISLHFSQCLLICLCQPPTPPTHTPHRPSERIGPDTGSVSSLHRAPVSYRTHPWGEPGAPLPPP